MYRAVRNNIWPGDEIIAGTSGWPARSLSMHQLLAAPYPQIAGFQLGLSSRPGQHVICTSPLYYYLRNRKNEHLKI